MKITLAQTSPKLNKSNLDEVLKIVNSVKNSSDLIVFPELSLSGYMLQDKLLEDAWSINELSKLRDLSENIDIVVGCAFRENDFFRNTALYFHKKCLLSKHHKVHLPNYGMFEEARYFESGEIFESFLVNEKRISMLICEDLWHKSVHQDLIKENPDFIIALVASPSRGFEEKGLEIEDKWMNIIKKIALECNAKLIFVNRVGFEDGLGFWGGSCIVNNDALIKHKLPHYKELIKTFDI